MGAAELLHRKAGWPSRSTRRMVHVATGLYVVATPYLFRGGAAVYLLAGTFVLINGVTAARGWLRGMHPVGPASWGTLAFPLGLLMTLPWTWGTERIFALQIAFLVLAIADPLAAVVGNRWPLRRTGIENATKSLGGSAAFLAATWLLTFLGLQILAGDAIPDPSWRLALLSLTVAAAATAVEALGGRGWDNLFIVLAVVLLLITWHSHPSRLPAMVFGTVAGMGFSFLSWRLRYLTLSGAIAGGLFAATLIGVGGPEWAVPGFVFFFLSSALSRWAAGSRRQRRDGGAGAEAGRRDAVQVYANGGVAWLLLVVHALEPQVWIYWGFVASLAAAAADTWATEVGPLFRQQPRMVLSGRPVPAGTSGAVTWAGTLAGVTGAIVVWAATVSVAPATGPAGGLWGSLLAVVGGGVAGSLADSIAGATIQAVYREPGTGRLLDGRVAGMEGLSRVRGWRWVDNDVVNVICTLVGAAVGMAVAAG